MIGSHPVSFGNPVDMWEPDNGEFEDHAEAGTFSRGWPTLWQAYCLRFLTKRDD